jgi:hypothetical protein
VVSAALSVAAAVVSAEVASATVVTSGADVTCGAVGVAAVSFSLQAIIGRTRTSSKSIAIMRTSFIFSTPLVLYLYFTIKSHPCQVSLFAKFILI